MTKSAVQAKRKPDLVSMLAKMELEQMKREERQMLASNRKDTLSEPRLTVVLLLLILDSCKLIFLKMITRPVSYKIV